MSCFLLVVSSGFSVRGRGSLVRHFRCGKVRGWLGNPLERFPFSGRTCYVPSNPSRVGFTGSSVVVTMLRVARVCSWLHVGLLLPVHYIVLCCWDELFL